MKYSGSLKTKLRMQDRIQQRVQELVDIERQARAQAKKILDAETPQTPVPSVPLSTLAVVPRAPPNSPSSSKSSRCRSRSRSRSRSPSCHRRGGRRGCNNYRRLTIPGGFINADYLNGDCGYYGGAPYFAPPVPYYTTAGVTAARVCGPQGCDIITRPTVTTCTPFGCNTAYGAPNLMPISLNVRRLF
jgi:hypothetical protein